MGTGFICPKCRSAIKSGATKCPSCHSDIRPIRDPDDVIRAIGCGVVIVIVRGSSLAQHMTAIWGCRLCGDTDDGPLKYIKRSVSFTEKTRYLFEIYKGLNQANTDRNPFLVNNEVRDISKTIPWCNIIYVGDGLTDVPCFSLVKARHGMALATDEKGPRSNQFGEMMESRVVALQEAYYSLGRGMGRMIMNVVANKCHTMLVEQNRAY